MNEMNVMEKEIRDVESKYSLYFNEKKKFDDLYRVFTTMSFVIISLCLYDISQTAFEILELFVK